MVNVVCLRKEEDIEGVRIIHGPLRVNIFDGIAWDDPRIVLDNPKKWLEQKGEMFVLSKVRTFEVYDGCLYLNSGLTFRRKGTILITDGIEEITIDDGIEELIPGVFFLS